ncbi:molybdopterin converting factor subunit 1 [Hydrogenobacter thermophilus]|uniref:molybdopterin converting factor subunit 1 n=1 Tax=Hydrogenobacter thermophilus TaxID=940 RepID=UPI0030F9B0B4
MKVLYFSVVKERIKKGEEELDFKGTVSELRFVLSQRYPELKDLLERIKFAVNEEYVGDDYELKGDERVALIPPVSGG